MLNLMTEEEKNRIIKESEEARAIAEREEKIFWQNEYPSYSQSEKRKYWGRMFYWDFKNSYIENDIDHFSLDRLNYMKQKDEKFHEIQNDVIQDFVDFICGDEETLKELKRKLNLND